MRPLTGGSGGAVLVTLAAALLVSGLLFGGVLATWNLALLWGEVARVTLLFYLSPV